MTDYATVFGSLREYQKGGVEIIDDDPKSYVFSNLFEVASRSAPYERVAVAKNFEYVIEALRAEGASPWFAAPHDEFALCLDGSVEIRLSKLDRSPVEPASEGAIRLDGDPEGRRMGRIVLGRGHMALLPAGAAYRFHAEKPAAMILQTIRGPLTVEKWGQICQTERTEKRSS